MRKEKTPVPDVNIAVAQFAPKDSGNLSELATFTAEARALGAKLVVFPEYSAWFQPRLSEAYREHAETVPGAFTAALQELASEHEMTIVAGLVERSGEQVYNAVVAVDASGVVASYRKQHLYDAFGSHESAWLSHGEITEPQTFDIEGVRFGLMTCYDLRFPELARVITDAGVHAIIVPAEWVSGPNKQHHWQTLIRARAIENTVYVAAADQIPPIAVGLSTVVDPLGLDQVVLGSDASVATVSISTDVIDSVRKVNPALALRRYQVTPRDV